MLTAASILLLQAPLPVSALASGRIVSEADGKVIVGAQVTPAPEWNLVTPARTNDAGLYTFIPQPGERSHLRFRPKLHGDEMGVEAAGFAKVTVDTSSRAPWANEIPLRRTKSVFGNIHGAGVDFTVVGETNASDFVWPPQSGLTIMTTSPSATVGADGSFTLKDVPMWAGITLRVKCPADPAWRVLGRFVFGDADEKLSFELPPPPATPVAADDADEWHFVGLFGRNAEGLRRTNAWFDVQPNARQRSHPWGGGRWHVHGNRACDCIESRAGERLLVARDPDGWFGLRTVTIAPDAGVTRYGITLSPGALLRIQLGKGLAGRVSLVAAGRVFAARDALPEELWYELSPAGEIELRLEVPERAMRTIPVVVVAGEVRRIQISD
ncbi:MAG: hypothetical protein JNL28_01175 [Planctomycetes bacterium]|nr:hypothetical protein [Planctomycetota bacterium]